MMTRERKPVSPLMRLALGACVGALCAVLVLLDDSSGRSLDAGAIASVNGRRLQLEEYQRAMRLFASEKRSAVNEADKRLILERMIEEELLRQHGVDVGLVRNDPAVRAEILRSVMTSLTAEMQARGDDDTGGSSTRYDPLVDYLGQLRAGATIRWSGSEAGQ